MSCAIPYTRRWVDYISRRLFPGVIYRHIILTVPDFLRIWFYRFRELLDPFIQAGFDCLNEVFATSARSKLDIGSIILPQTFGRKANWNTHLHIIQTAGGIDENNRWRHQTYIPYDELHHAWKDHLLGMLKSNILDPRMEADIERADKLYPDGLVAHLVKGLVPPGGKGLARYLAKYVVSPPIAIRRIESYDGVHVRYWYRDHKTAQIEYETLPVLRFIGRMVEHILPKGFQRIRYFGLHSNRRYSKIRQCLPELLPNKPPKINNECYRVLPRPSFEKLYSETFNSNPLKCPECGDKMELELIWHPAYGVITSYEHLLYLESAPYDTPRGPPRGAAALARRTQRVVQIPLPFM